MKKQVVVVFIMLIAMLIGGCANGATEEMIEEIEELKTQVAQLSAEKEKLEEEVQELKQDNIQDDQSNENTINSDDPFPVYTAWIEQENSVSERDVYESIFTGFLYADDEISRGWLDEGTVKFLTLIKGDAVSADAYASELKKIYKSLDDNISNTDYSIRDFFCVDQYGDPVSTGIYNFFRSIDQLEASKFNGTDVVFTNSSGNITGWDFDAVGGDVAIAEALGVNPELVLIIQHAAIDSGFKVTFD